MLLPTLAWIALAAACDRPLPEPTGYHARGFGQVAEVFPARSRRNAGVRPIVYLYEVGYPGTAWDVSARRRWAVELPGERFPEGAVVSTDGHVALLADPLSPSEPDALVVLGSEGRLLGRWTLGDLLAPEEIEGLPWSDCGILWREGARYLFVGGDRPFFHVALAGGTLLAVDLSAGTLASGPVERFPEVAELLARPFANEEVEVWPTSLRFSSITDVLARPGGPAPTPP